MLQSRLPYECACVSCELAPKVNSNTYDMTLLPRRCAQTDAASNEFLHLTLTVPITLSALFCGMVITMITCSFGPETQCTKLKYFLFSKNTMPLAAAATLAWIVGETAGAQGSGPNGMRAGSPSGVPSAPGAGPSIRYGMSAS